MTMHCWQKDDESDKDFIDNASFTKCKKQSVKFVALYSRHLIASLTGFKIASNSSMFIKKRLVIIELISSLRYSEISSTI